MIPSISCSLRGTILLLSAASVLACEPEVKIPLLPDLDLTGVLPAVEEQIKLYVERVEADPRMASANGQLGMVLDAYSQPDAAVVLYTRARAFDPNAFSWSYYLGTALSKLGDHKNAEDAYRHAVDLDPENPHALLGLADILLVTGNVVESRAMYERILRKYPQRADAHFGYAKLLEHENKPDEAIQEYRRALSLNGPFGKGFFALASAHRSAGDTIKNDELLALYDRYKNVPLKSDDPLTKEIENLRIDDRRYVTDARRFAKLGQYREAIDALGQALEKNPVNPDIHTLFIQYYSELGEWKKGEAHYRSGLDIDPNWDRLHLLFGNLRFAQERYADAVVAFEKAVASNPGNAPARVNLGVALEMVGHVDRAEDEYRRALKSDPTPKRANHRLARYLSERNQFSEAIRLLERTLEPVDAKTPKTMCMLGQIHMFNGSPTKAISTLEQAKELAVKMNDNRLAAMIAEDLNALAQTRNAVPP